MCDTSGFTDSVGKFVAIDATGCGGFAVLTCAASIHQLEVDFVLFRIQNVRAEYRVSAENEVDMRRTYHSRQKWIGTLFDAAIV